MSNQSTPTGYAPDGPPAIYNDQSPARKNAQGTAGQTFTPATATPKVASKASTGRNDSPALANGSSFSTIAAPSSFTLNPTQWHSKVPA